MKYSLIQHILGVIFLMIVAAPNIPGLGMLRFEDISLVIAAFLIVLFKKGGKAMGAKRMVSVGRYFAIIAVSGILGMSTGAVFEGVPIVGRDLMFLPQIAKYYLIFWVAAEVLSTPTAVRCLMTYIMIGAAICAGVGIMQYWNLFGVNEWLTPLYWSSTIDTYEIALKQMQDAEMDFRVKGTIGHPNYFGYLLVWFVAWLVSFGIDSGRGSVPRFLLWPVLGVVVIAIMLVQSRITIATVLLLFAVSGGMVRQNSKRVVVVSLGVVAALVVVLFLKGDWVEERGYGKRLALDSDSTQLSYGSRVRDFVRPVGTVLEKPYLIPFGQGPSKGVLRSDSHNGYTWILQRFGLVGLVAYLALFFTQFRMGQKLSARGRTKVSRVIGLVGISTTIVWMAGELGGNIFKDPRLMSVNMISLACVLRAGRLGVGHKRGMTKVRGSKQSAPETDQVAGR